MFKVSKWFRRRSKPTLAGLAVLILLVSFAGGFLVGDTGVRDKFVNVLEDFVVTIGPETAEAAVPPDYTCDGAADDVQFQQAVDALPAGGGTISILPGTYTFTATVSRAINSVIWEGAGKSTLINYNGSTAVISAGNQSDWVFRDFSTDAGGLGVSSASTWTKANIYEGTAYVAYQTSSDIDGSEWDIPSGRSATLTIAANDASDSFKAQADYLCSGSNDEVQINAAFAALPATGGSVELSEGTFWTNATINMEGFVWLRGQGWRTTSIVPTDGIDVFTYDGVWWSDLSDLYIKGTLQTTGGRSIYFKQVDPYANWHNRFSNLWLTGYKGLENDFNGTDVSADNRFIHCTFGGYKYQAVKMSVNSTGYWYFTSCVFDQTGLSSGEKDAAAAHHFRFEGAHGLVMTDCGFTNVAYDAVRIANGQFLTMQGVGVDHADWNDVVLYNWDYVRMSDCRFASAAQKDGAVGAACLRLDDVNYGNINNVMIGSAGGPLTNYGIYIHDSSYLNLNNVAIALNSSTGLLIDGSSNIRVDNSYSINNGGNGVHEIGGSDYNKFTNVKASGNSLNQYVSEAGSHNTYDVNIVSGILDLSGASTDIEVFYADTNYQLVSYIVLYTEGTSGDAGVYIRIGDYDDDDAYDLTVSEASKSKGYAYYYNTNHLTALTISAGQTVTVGTEGGKVGAGEILFILKLVSS